MISPKNWTKRGSSARVEKHGGFLVPDPRVWGRKGGCVIESLRPASTNPWLQTETISAISLEPLLASKEEFVDPDPGVAQARLSSAVLPIHDLSPRH